MLDKKETYLYGTLLELVHEQLIAWEKHQQGKLGMWGRARASSRNETIDKFVQKIIDYKAGRGQGDPIGEIMEDLTFIQQDNAVWGGISNEQIEFLGNLLTGR
jgi:hypothetical protein